MYPKNNYKLHETLTEKLNGLNNEYTKDQCLIGNMAIFDFESVGVSSEEVKSTKTITWIGKHDPIPVSTSSNFLVKSIFLSVKNPNSLRKPKYDRKF